MIETCENLDIRRLHYSYFLSYFQNQKLPSSRVVTLVTITMAMVFFLISYTDKIQFNFLPGLPVHYVRTTLCTVWAASCIENNDLQNGGIMTSADRKRHHDIFTFSFTSTPENDDNDSRAEVDGEAIHQVQASRGNAKSRDHTSILNKNIQFNRLRKKKTGGGKSKSKDVSNRSEYYRPKPAARKYSDDEEERLSMNNEATLLSTNVDKSKGIKIMKPLANHKLLKYSYDILKKPMQSNNIPTKMDKSSITFGVKDKRLFFTVTTQSYIITTKTSPLSSIVLQNQSVFDAGKINITKEVYKHRRNQTNKVKKVIRDDHLPASSSIASAYYNISHRSLPHIINAHPFRPTTTPRVTMTSGNMSSPFSSKPHISTDNTVFLKDSFNNFDNNSLLHKNVNSRFRSKSFPVQKSKESILKQIKSLDNKDISIRPNNYTSSLKFSNRTDNKHHQWINLKAKISTSSHQSGYETVEFKPESLRQDFDHQGLWLFDKMWQGKKLNMPRFSHFEVHCYMFM